MLYASLSSSTFVMIGVVLGLLIGTASTLGWGIISRSKNQLKSASRPFDTRDDIIVGLLVLAAFAMGVFLTYALLSIRL
jgi:hypothetical protein